MKQHRFSDYLSSLGQSTSTSSTNLQQAGYFFDWCEQEGIESEDASNLDILYYIRFHKSKGVCQRTIQSYLNAASHYFMWLLHLEKRSDDPTQHIDIKCIKRRSLYPVLDIQHLESLYHSIPIPEEDSKDINQNWFHSSVLTAKRNKVMLGLLIWQGTDATALSQISVEDILLTEGKIYIPATRKTNESTLDLTATQVMPLM